MDMKTRDTILGISGFFHTCGNTDKKDYFSTRVENYMARRKALYSADER